MNPSSAIRGNNSSGPSSSSSSVRWAIRVTYPNGSEAWLRRGHVIGRGPIVQFRTRQSAEREAEFMREGMDRDGGDGVLTIVQLRGTER